MRDILVAGQAFSPGLSFGTIPPVWSIDMDMEVVRAVDMDMDTFTAVDLDMETSRVIQMDMDMVGD